MGFDSQTPDASEEIPVGEMVGEYRVAGKLGEGGMGAVYSAEHPLIGKKAAIKVIRRNLCSDRGAIERFVQEARAVNQIGHPNIVDVFAFGVIEDNRSYFVMEWLQGETLGDRIAREPIPFPEAIGILDQIADALEAAHEKGIVHRDLKPDNVFLVPVRGGRQLVKLLDFGLAKLHAGDNRISRTRTGIMMGTPGYISPEQARGKDVDWHTDLYALGCMAYEVLSGRLPYEVDNAMEMVAMHLSAPVPRLSTVWPACPPEVDAIVAGLMDKAALSRPPLAHFRNALQSLLEISAIQRPAGFVARMATPVPGAIPTASLRAGMPTPTPIPSPVADVGHAPTMASSAAMLGPEALGRKKRWKWLAIAAGLVAALGGVALVVAMQSPGAGASGSGGGKAAETVPQSAGVESAPPTAPPAPPTAPAASSATPEVAPATSGATASAPETPAQTPAAASATLVIKVNTPAHIELDGKVVAESAESVSLPTTAGSHKLAFSARGRKAFERDVAVEAGKKLDVPVHLDRTNDGPARPTSTGKPPVTTSPASTPASTPAKSTPGKKDKDYVIDPFAK